MIRKSSEEKFSYIVIQKSLRADIDTCKYPLKNQNITYREHKSSGSSDQKNYGSEVPREQEKLETLLKYRASQLGIWSHEAGDITTPLASECPQAVIQRPHEDERNKIRGGKSDPTPLEVLEKFIDSGTIF